MGRGRPRRVPDKEGRIICNYGSGHLEHIQEFYQQTGAYISWENPEDGITYWFGRPDSYCIPHRKQYNKDRRAEAEARQRAIEEMEAGGKVRYAGPREITQPVDEYIAERKAKELEEVNRNQVLMDKPVYETWEEAHQDGKC